LAKVVNTNGVLMKKVFLIVAIFYLSHSTISAQYITKEKFDWEGGRPEGCTTILVGKEASEDGSVMNSHTDDSHRDKAWMDIEQAKDFPDGAMSEMRIRTKNDSAAMTAYTFQPIGEIPQVRHTYKYINTGYPCMNEHQLAIGESTMGGRDELKSEKGLIDCYQLVHLMMQRTKTAREAIELARILLDEYGWNDYGECLTIADTKEIWMMEIFGPGEGKIGAVWAAQRVPDDHISTNANASRITNINLQNADYFRASENVYDVAKVNGWWNEDEVFQFCYAYDPDGRKSLSSRRREWRVLSLAAPSLKLDPNTENYPFSVKPDEKISKWKMVEMFRDYYQDTPYDMRKTITWTNEEGKTEISPLANPFMPYDELKTLRINGGWNELGERTIARWYTMYATITQSRDWLPNEVGGVVWFAWDNVATSIYVPIYSSIEKVPDSYKFPGRINGFSHESAWWAFNRLSGITAQRWGDMSKDVHKVWDEWQKELFRNQELVETNYLNLVKEKNKSAGSKMLTEYSNEWSNRVVKKAWQLGDFLWTKYDEKF
jgi:dipeptidase